MTKLEKLEWEKDRALQAYKRAVEYKASDKVKSLLFDKYRKIDVKVEKAKWMSFYATMKKNETVIDLIHMTITEETNFQKAI